jgi:hypothetical protein
MTCSCRVVSCHVNVMSCRDTVKCHIRYTVVVSRLCGSVAPSLAHSRCPGHVRGTHLTSSHLLATYLNLNLGRRGRHVRNNRSLTTKRDRFAWLPTWGLKRCRTKMSSRSHLTPPHTLFLIIAWPRQGQASIAARPRLVVLSVCSVVPSGSATSAPTASPSVHSTDVSCASWFPSTSPSSPAPSSPASSIHRHVLSRPGSATKCRRRRCRRCH